MYILNTLKSISIFNYFKEVPNKGTKMTQSKNRVCIGYRQMARHQLTWNLTVDNEMRQCVSIGSGRLGRRRRKTLLFSD